MVQVSHKSAWNRSWFLPLDSQVCLKYIRVSSNKYFLKQVILVAFCVSHCPPHQLPISHIALRHFLISMRVGSRGSCSHKIPIDIQNTKSSKLLSDIFMSLSTSAWKLHGNKPTRDWASQWGQISHMFFGHPVMILLCIFILLVKKLQNSISPYNPAINFY